jgi:hypothetical protein
MTRSVVSPAAAVTTGKQVVDVAIVEDGATHLCTVTLEDQTKKYYKVEHTIVVTPTDDNWKRL